MLRRDFFGSLLAVLGGLVGVKAAKASGHVPMAGRLVGENLRECRFCKAHINACYVVCDDCMSTRGNAL